MLQSALKLPNNSRPSETAPVGCAKDDSLDNQTIPSDFAALFGVEGGPNNVLYSWRWSTGSGQQGQLPIGMVEIGEDVALSVDTAEELKSKFGQNQWIRFNRLPLSFDSTWFNAFKSLRGFSLCPTDLSKYDLSTCPEFPDLQWLNLSGSQLPSAKTFAKGFPRLETLYLRSSQFSESQVEWINKSPSIRSLDLAFSDLTDEQLKQLVESNPKIRALSLLGCQNISTRSVETLLKCRDLEYLRIESTPMVSENYENVKRLRRGIPHCYLVVFD